MMMMKSIVAAAAVALALNTLCVESQILTELNFFEAVAQPQYQNEFTILNRMIQKWFPGEEDQPNLITDCETPLTFFAPTDEAWDNSWILQNLNTDSEELLVNYFQIPEVILYHIITAGGFDPNQLTPGTDEGNFFFTLNGSPIFVGLNQTASGTLFPYVTGPYFEESNIQIDSSVERISICGGSVVYFLTQGTLFPPGMNIPNEGSGNLDWAPAPGGTSAYFPIGLQQTDLYTDDLNGNTRGLPVCTVGGVRAPFSSCEYPPISQVLGYCPALRFDRNSARDPVGQEMNSGFQSQYFPGYTPGTIDTARINPTCPTATENLYGPFGISFSLTLLSFCELIGVIDDDSVDLTLFLPTNEAWLKATSTAVPPISPNALFSAPYDAWICDLVKYHAVPEKIQYFGDLPDGSSLPTLAGENFDLFVRSQGLERKINQSLVQFLSLESSNTVVYRVDYPLNPQTGPAYFPDYPGSTDGQPSVTP